jgi:hypothetical protein
MALCLGLASIARLSARRFTRMPTRCSALAWRRRAVAVTALSAALVPVRAGASEPASSSELRRTLNAFAEQASAARRQLPILETSGFSGSACLGKQLLRAGDVATSYARLRGNLLAKFSAKATYPLRDWLDENLPKSPPPPDPGLAQCGRGIPVLGQAAVDELWNHLQAKTKRVEQLPSLVITLRVTSVPRAGAPFVLRPQLSDQIIVQDRTDAKVDSVVRGLWRVSVNLEGYKPVVLQPINLVDSLSETLECQLARNDQPESSACGLR